MNIKNIFFLSLSLALLTSNARGDDILLTIVPVIAAINQCNVSNLSQCKTKSTCESAGGNWDVNKCQTNASSLLQITKLTGDWLFKQVDDSFSPSIVTIGEFRFYRNTITKSGATTHTIEGDEFLGDFGFIYEEDVAAVYDTDANFYLTLSIWGPPTYDSGSAYLFKSADKNTNNFDCHYFTDAQGNIRDYYIGFGGSIECDILTKSKRNARLKTSNSGSVNAQSSHSGSELKAALWTRHLENERQSDLAKSRKFKQKSPYANKVQSLIHALMMR